LNKNLKSHLAIIGANIIWGLNYVIAKGIMPDFLLPRAIIFLRVSGTVVVLWVLHFSLPSQKVKLPAHRAGLPGKEESCFLLRPLSPPTRRGLRVALPVK
jgi:drug/metabolite transporter (DMT)-like permease